MNSYVGGKSSHNGVGRRLRLPTVDEALPFSPLTSIVPFSPDLIPYPSSGSTRYSSLTGAHGTLPASRNGFTAIDSEANIAPTSDRLERALKDLKQLLEDKELTTFNFSRPAVPSTAPQRHANGAVSPQLSTLSKMVLDNTAKDFRYPTPVSPPEKIAQTSPPPIAPKPPTVERKNAKAFQQNVRLSASIHQTQQIHPSPGIPAVVLPSSSQATEYQEFPEVDAKVLSGQGLSKKRPRLEHDVESSRLDRRVDVRAQSDDALAKLQEQILDILEAEDQLESDTSGAAPAASSSLFELGQVSDSDVPILSHQATSRLLLLMQNVVSYGRFGEVPVDYLARVQRLCDRAVGTLESISLKVGDGWSEADIEEWAQQVEMAESRIHAARLLLRIMTAGRDDRQLFSEDFVTQVINGIKHVVDTGIVEAVETRNTGDAKNKFSILVAHKKSLGSLFQMCSRALKLLGDFLVQVDVSETSIAPVEFLCKDVIFVENGHSEKDSAVGIQRFETLRLVAMDVMAKIFARYPDQRNSIFQEILTSLGRLTTTRQSARQFKLRDGKPIQLVSALLMRLVQSCAAPNLERGRKLASLDGVTGQADSEGENKPNQSPNDRTISQEQGAVMSPTQLLLDLKNAVRTPAESMVQSAAYVVQFLLHRAQNATKTGETPYRNLLDLFAEDFLSVLGCPEWPGAEILLHQMFVQMLNLLQASNVTVPAKNMALDLMGLMGAGILDLQTTVRNSLRILDASESELSAKLSQLAHDILEEGQADTDAVDFDGPFRMAIEHLNQDEGDAQMQSAKSVYLVQWIRSTLSLLERNEELDDDELEPFKDLILQLRNSITDPQWLEREYEFEAVSPAQGRLASGVVILNLGFCRAIGSILQHLLHNMTSEHAHLKSRSFKSIEQLLDKNPAILDRSATSFQVLRCCGDPKSSLARDSALKLYSKILEIKPALDVSSYQRLLPRLSDEANSVKKRALRLLKDITLRNENVEMKATIAAALLRKIQDHDTAVADLARQCFEEMWMLPFYAVLRSDGLQARMALRGQISLIVKIAQRGDETLALLETLLQSLLSNDAKNPSENFKVCNSMVVMLFDSLVDQEHAVEELSPRLLLQTMAVFARSSPKLFTAQQLQYLEPYIQQLTSSEDAAHFRLSILIFRHVFPSLSSVQKTFLERVQSKLFENMSKLGRGELLEVWPCLWAIYGELKNENRILRLTSSVLTKIRGMPDELSQMTKTPEGISKNKVQSVERLLLIAGNIGKACDLEPFLETFRAVLKDSKISSVASFMVDTICPLTKQKYPIGLRKTALESIGMLCQSSPEQFLRPEVVKAFDLVFRNDDLQLQQVALSAFQAFFNQAEKRSESGADIKVGEGQVHGSERLGQSLVATDSDSAAAGIAQQFLRHVLRVALSDHVELALTSTKVLASISRQGLVHPRECGSALVALETSPDRLVAEIAFKEHRAVHEKHETMFEKEYMKAIQQAFRYQKDVYGSPGGATSQPYAAKLKVMYDVLNMGSSKVRKRFLANISSRCSFELSKLDIPTEGVAEHVEFTRFCMENVAFFDYARVDDLLVLVSNLEKVVTGTGTAIAHAIDTDIYKVKIEAASSDAIPQDVPMIRGGAESNQQHADQQAPEASRPEEIVDRTRLRKLATACAVLLIVWETRTFLRRLWNLGRHTSATTTANDNDSKPKGKAAVKELGKPANKNPGITGDKFIERVAGFFNGLASGETEAELMLCRVFAELMSVDNELRVADNDNGDAIMAAATGYETPSEDEGSQGHPGPSSGRGRKRKASFGRSATPKRQKVQKTPSKRGAARRKRSASIASTNDDGENGGWD